MTPIPSKAPDRLFAVGRRATTISTVARWPSRRRRSLPLRASGRSPADRFKEIMDVNSLSDRLASAPAWAWGRSGHRVIARLAEWHLTDRSKVEIKALLEPGESLAHCSTWADEVRGKMRKTAPLALRGRPAR